NRAPTPSPRRCAPASSTPDRISGAVSRPVCRTANENGAFQAPLSKGTVVTIHQFVAQASDYFVTALTSPSEILALLAAGVASGPVRCSARSPSSPPTGAGR